MKTIFLGSAAAAAFALAIPAVASAQQLPPAVVAIVDTDRILTSCTACVAANGQLQQQQAQAQARAQQLQAPLQTEGQAIQTAVNALQGRPADAALQARVRTWETQRDAAQRELQGREETLRRNIGFVRQQILQRLQPVVQQVAQQRGATVALDASQTLFGSPALDITPAVLAGLNTALPSVNVNAPPPQQQAPAPAAQTPQSQRPRTGGR